MKQFNVSYVEVIQDNRAISSCFYQDNANVNYGSIIHDDNVDNNFREPAESPSAVELMATPNMFHKLINDVVVPNVVPVLGNKVTKVSMHILDGYDCYYTTSDTLNGSITKDTKLFVCINKITVPKILPIRLLSELKQLAESNDEGGEPLSFDTDEELSLKVGGIIDQFREDLISYRNKLIQDNEANGNYNNGREGNHYQDTDEELNEVLKIMNDNIDKFLKRQEKISLLVDKTSLLNSSSVNFKKRAVKLKNKMWWQRFKNMTLLFFSIIFIIGVILMFYYDFI
ncbi:hypothetical protein TPHA_0A01710 [Tetrapisispora phaffii CBS 4417]|uniref:V-SNARE coiled-coil homology domain-containing protein n=1 Tax=Tetrapisispora phaffii (strain ATCC 24235 / CBS 4417 / NBRC 1672 / NRRL Y-8282 / UCD 70-5) TaxID=1071381 RepID=G8BMX6_TETPH|nr:hypothetical protein TPHA_0A01710 [Tetrapisispora phaffii CBS 4417]CCE61254.1 hypothetical protein TPHA_0A01710 [Tetrapisispora phaffii CBS 4417]